MDEVTVKEFFIQHKYALMFFAFISVVTFIVINNPLAPVPTSANSSYRPVRSIMQFNTR